MLVMYEALRLQELEAGRPRLVNNVMSIEAAVWREAFEPEEPLSYPWPQQAGNHYWAHTDDNTINYSVDQLQHMSWLAWFRQMDNNVEHSIPSVIDGRIFHNYAAEDYALYDWMRKNDGFRVGSIGHYSRNEARYRTLSDDGSDNYSMQRVTALMSDRERWFWNLYDLNLPVGCVPSAMANVVQINAPAVTAHGNDSDWRIDNHDAFRSESYPQMYNWYRYFFAGGNLQNPIPVALPMGQEK